MSEQLEINVISEGFDESAVVNSTIDVIEWVRNLLRLPDTTKASIFFGGTEILDGSFEYNGIDDGARLSVQVLEDTFETVINELAQVHNSSDFIQSDRDKVP